MNLRWPEYLKLRTSDGYTYLPLNAMKSENTCLCLRLPVPKRCSRLFLQVGLLIALGFIFFFDTGLLFRRNSYPQVLLTPPSSSSLPPLYEAYTEYENNLPQQQDDNFAERKYIYMANHVFGLGWNNVLQDMIYNCLVASEAGRGFVWYDYTWNREGPPYTDYNGKMIPSHVPLSTMLSGYVLGLNSGNRVPNATRPISRALYERICPPQERVYIDRDSVVAQYQLDPANSGASPYDISGTAILTAWLNRLNQPDTKDARCVEVKINTLQAFDFMVRGSKKLQSIWKFVVNSPMIAGWSWSPLIYEAFERYREVISPITSSKSSSSSRLGNSFNESDTLPLLAIHVRRGDFHDHCVNMAGWDSHYIGQNSFPEFEERDKFVVPQVIEGYSNNSGSTLHGDTLIVSSQDEKVKYYLKHCSPDIGQMVERVRQVVHDYESFVRERSRRGYRKYEDWGLKRTRRQEETRRDEEDSESESVANKLLKRIYIMSNGDRQFLLNLKQALMDDAERSKKLSSDEGERNDWEFEWTWEGISTNRDLELGWEEKPVAQALDMYVGQRSELFIGNGFSSMTCNIVLLRMKDGREPLQMRFW